MPSATCFSFSSREISGLVDIRDEDRLGFGSLPYAKGSVRRQRADNALKGRERATNRMVPESSKSRIEARSHFNRALDGVQCRLVDFLYPFGTLNPFRQTIQCGLLTESAQPMPLPRFRLGDVAGDLGGAIMRPVASLTGER